MDQPIGIRLPKELLKKLDMLSKKQMEDRSTVIRKLVMAGYQQQMREKAVEEYRGGKITFSEAAHKADFSLWEFEKYLVEKGYKSEYSIDDLEKEIGILSK